MRCMAPCRYSIDMAEMWSVYMALLHLDDAGAVHTDHVGVVQVLERGDEHCMSAGHNDADGWALMWKQMRAIEGTTVQVGVKWVEAHTTHMRRLSMTSEQKFILKGNDEAAEIAKQGTIECGEEKGQFVAAAVRTSRQDINAAIRYDACFHVSVEESKRRGR